MPVQLRQLFEFGPLQVRQLALQLVQVLLEVSPYSLLGQVAPQVCVAVLRKLGVAQERQLLLFGPEQERQALLQFTQIRVGVVCPY